MLRKPGAKEDFVRGKTGQFPFAPGGIEGVSAEAETGRTFRINEKTRLGPLSSIPPGFPRGLRLKSDEDDLDLENIEIDEAEDIGEVVRSVHTNKVDAPQGKEIQIGFEAIDDLLPDEVLTSLHKL